MLYIIWKDIELVHRVVSRFFSSRFHPTSGWLFPFYFSNIMLSTDLPTFGVTGAVFKIAGEMCRLLAYFDNPESIEDSMPCKTAQNSMLSSGDKQIY